MTALQLAGDFVSDPYSLPPTDSVERRHQYLMQCRRVRVGPSVTAVFENRQTLWFRVQELAQVARLTRADRVQTELDWYQRLLPEPGRLCAAVWVAEPGRRPSRALVAVRKAIVGGHIAFKSDDRREIPGFFRTDRVGDSTIGLTLWAEFQISGTDRSALADLRRSWRLDIQSEGYNFSSDPIADSVRFSLIDDLT